MHALIFSATTVRGYRLGLEDVKQLARGLPRSSLMRLDLAENKLGSGGLVAIVRSLRLSHIQNLGLERNSFGLGEGIFVAKTAHDRGASKGTA